ncbi:MAG: carbonic anhydrase [Planctomycetota bacterium]
MLRTALLVACIALAACATDRPDPPVRDVRTAEEVALLTPAATLELLKAGNVRFVSRTLTDQDWKAQLEASATELHPWSAVLTTPDPRIPLPLVFDLGIGDMIEIRTPGPVVTPAVARGLEHAVFDSQVKVIVVMGHSDCGVVGVACAGTDDPYLSDVVAEIRPSIDATPRESSERVIQGMAYADAVAAEHAIQTAAKLRASSERLAEASANGTVAIVPAYYDVATGAIIWL